MKIYYRDNKIINVWSVWHKGAPPEEAGNIEDPYEVIELDEEYNRKLASLLLANDRTPGNLPDRFSVVNGNLVNNDTQEVVTPNPNPQKESYKLSQLYGLTQQQLETYIENNVTNLAQAKEFIKKLSAVVLWLVKQTRLDDS